MPKDATQIGLTEPGQQEHEQTIVRVLVVDDEEKLGRFVGMLLDQMGYRATVCLRVEEAKRLLAHGKWDLVITDIVLPGENGFDLIHWINEYYQHVPVVAMTAHSTAAVNHRIRRLGFAGILHKPFSIEQFQRVIEQTGLPVLLETPLRFF